MSVFCFCSSIFQILFSDKIRYLKMPRRYPRGYKEMPKRGDKETTRRAAQVCRYHDKGYCRLRENCFFYHPKENCKGNCDRKTCLKRHPNKCSYGNDCRRYHCAYKH